MGRVTAWSYGRIRVSDTVLDLMAARWDPRPVYGPPAPRVPHVCNCQYCDLEEEL